MDGSTLPRYRTAELQIKEAWLRVEEQRRKIEQLCAINFTLFKTMQKKI